MKKKNEIEMPKGVHTIETPVKGATVIGWWDVKLQARGYLITNEYPTGLVKFVEKQEVFRDMFVAKITRVVKL